VPCPGDVRAGLQDPRGEVVVERRDEDKVAGRHRNGLFNGKKAFSLCNHRNESAKWN
jgi:hypothetical protein